MVHQFMLFPICRHFLFPHLVPISRNMFHAYGFCFSICQYLFMSISKFEKDQVIIEYMGRKAHEPSGYRIQQLSSYVEPMLQGSGGSNKGTVSSLLQSASLDPISSHHLHLVVRKYAFYFLCQHSSSYMIFYLELINSTG